MKRLPFLIVLIPVMALAGSNNSPISNLMEQHQERVSNAYDAYTSEVEKITGHTISQLLKAKTYAEGLRTRSGYEAADEINNTITALRASRPKQRFSHIPPGEHNMVVTGRIVKFTIKGSRVTSQQGYTGVFKRIASNQWEVTFNHGPRHVWVRIGDRIYIEQFGNNKDTAPVGAGIIVVK